jgi:hypothetical protein
VLLGVSMRVECEIRACKLFCKSSRPAVPDYDSPIEACGNFPLLAHPNYSAAKVSVHRVDREVFAGQPAR